VAHGCQAGLQQEACDKVYFARIQRGNEAYSVRLLGAFGSDLGAITCFFETQWSQVSPALSDPAQVWLLNEAGLILLSLGRLTDALDPMRAEQEMRVNKRVGLYRSANVERSASFLSELELTLGNVAKAVLAAEQSVGDLNSDRVEQMMTQHAKLANSLNQAGRPVEAVAHFHQAEAIQAKNEPTHPLLHSVPGFMYCDLLLAAPERAAWQRTLASSSLLVAEPIFEELLGSCSAVSLRAVQTLGWQTPRNLSLLSAGLDYVTLGRAALYQAILERTSFAPCETLLKKAVDRLRHAARQDELPKALLTRAWMRFLASDTEGARDDLDEAWEIAERGPMKLFMADIHLYRARLFHGVKPYPWKSPQEDLAAARKLIEQCGYWRRKEELEDAEAAAKNW
jgi:tetratricopeptide (TPR) repeat protein